ncbi:peroxiredoxin family protein [Dyadobacter sandarakinus]|uniref:TlpA family protein disulfide reductase n=1 Tax=Dyadobacter sandarakinus TaxID=2747268 RepID=A0ABX7I157_9BACT|nr:TlpA disulfide reductase family protein [Dyadobacter sandarakinus]QRQ99805.1 TlpA family protein disulfide reductase [Dyadobacter sandarakinus]
MKSFSSRLITYAVSAVLLLSSLNVQAQKTALKDGIWRGIFKIGDIEVPFNFEVSNGAGKAPVFTAINGDRRDEFQGRFISRDSIQVNLNTFETAWFARIESDGSISGVQKSLVPGNNSRTLSFTAAPGKSYRFIEPGKEVAPKADLSGRWWVKIKPDADAEGKPAPDRVAVFEQKGNKLVGIILSVSGDSRELEGNVQGDEFYLSGVTGSSPAYVKGKISSDQSISGTIGAGAHPTRFEGIKDDKAALPDAYALTFLKPGYDRLDFTFPDLEGKPVSLRDEKYKGKVVVIEIMGSWCPNCIDQITFLSPWYKENKSKGVEAIALAFEAKDDPAFAKNALTKLKNRYDMQYDILFAGKVGGNAVAEKLPAIDKFLAFPTTIIVGRDGKVKEIHTGFSGKGTGQFYQDYVKKWNEDLARLISEPLP